MPPVAQVAHAPVGMQFVEQVEIHVGDENHLGIRRRLGAFSVGWEGEVAGREDSGLGILDVHVVHAGQVSDAAGDDYEAFVLDGACLGTDADAGVAVLRVGQEGDEEDLHPLVGHEAGEFGELDVVANQDTDFGAVCLERLHHLASAEAPTLDLVRRNVDFLVHLVRPVAAAKEADVVERAVVLQVRHTSGDDVDVIADSEVEEAVAHFLGVLSQAADRLRLAEVVVLRHQRRVEVFGEEDEVALVVRDGIDEELDLFEDVVQCFVGAHLPLDEADADGRLLVDIFLRGRLIVDVVPLEERRAVAGLLVVREVILHHAADVEVVGELEGEDRVVDFAAADLVDVFLRLHLVGILVVVRDASAEHDRLEVQFLAQLLAVFVHTAGEAQAAIFGMNEDLDAVEDVALGVVGVEGLVAGNFRVCVVAFHQVVIDDDGKGTTDDFVVHDRNDLSFGENSDELFNLLVRPEDIFVRIDAGKGLGKLRVIFDLQVADLYLVNLMHCFHAYMLYIFKIYVYVV